MDVIRYKRDGRFMVPDLQVEEITTYGKYGQMRLDYLVNRRPDKHLYYLTNGILYQHLAEVDAMAKKIVDNQVKELLKTHPAPDQNETLAWTGHMNSLKQMAEEVVYLELIYV